MGKQGDYGLRDDNCFRACHFSRGDLWMESRISLKTGIKDG
jgi:hypothetical protein